VNRCRSSPGGHGLASPPPIGTKLPRRIFICPDLPLHGGPPTGIRPLPGPTPKLPGRHPGPRFNPIPAAVTKLCPTPHSTDSGIVVATEPHQPNSPIVRRGPPGRRRIPTHHPLRPPKRIAIIVGCRPCGGRFQGPERGPRDHKSSMRGPARWSTPHRLSAPGPPPGARPPSPSKQRLNRSHAQPFSKTGCSSGTHCHRPRPSRWFFFFFAAELVDAAPSRRHTKAPPSHSASSLLGIRCGRRSPRTQLAAPFFRRSGRTAWTIGRKAPAMAKLRGPFDLRTNPATPHLRPEVGGALGFPPDAGNHPTPALGPTEGRGAHRVQAIGRRPKPPPDDEFGWNYPSAHRANRQPRSNGTFPQPPPPPEHNRHSIRSSAPAPSQKSHQLHQIPPTGHSIGARREPSKPSPPFHRLTKEKSPTRQHRVTHDRSRPPGLDVHPANQTPAKTTTQARISNSLASGGSQTAVLPPCALSIKNNAAPHPKGPLTEFKYSHNRHNATPVGWR